MVQKGIRSQEKKEKIKVKKKQVTIQN